MLILPWVPGPILVLQAMVTHTPMMTEFDMYCK